MNIFRLSLVAVVIGSCWSSRATLAEPPKSYLKKVEKTPDLMQTLKQAKFAGGGKKFCAPVATSNSLMWLGSHGYPKLLPAGKGGQEAAQIKLVHLLASEKMMNTGAETGTGPRRLLRGVNRYVESCGYSCNKIIHQGWRPVPKKYQHKNQTPDLKWIKRGLANPRSGVMLNIGWYKAGKNKGEYERVGSHWMTLVGFQRDKKNPTAGEQFILHDPATRAGKAVSHERVFLKKIESGTFVGKWNGLPQNATGYYKLSGDFHLKKIADCAILDGVVVLELKAEP